MKNKVNKNNNIEKSKRLKKEKVGYLVLFQF